MYILRGTEAATRLSMPGGALSVQTCLPLRLWPRPPQVFEWARASHAESGRCGRRHAFSCPMGLTNSTASNGPLLVHWRNGGRCLASQGVSLDASDNYVTSGGKMMPAERAIELNTLSWPLYFLRKNGVASAS